MKGLRRGLFVFAALLMASGVADVGFAEQMNTGCGLGSIVFAGRQGLVFQVLAVTTNSTLGTQTFGITSGTSNCERPANLADNKKLNTFVAENMDNLAKDIAKGNGEYLTTLAVLMEVPQNEQAKFFSTLQSNFARIYPSDQVTHVDVLKNIESIVSTS